MSKPSTSFPIKIGCMNDLQSFYRMVASSNEDGEFERLSKLGEPYRSVFLAVCTEPFLVDNFVYYYQDVLKELNQYFVYATGFIPWVNFTYGYNDEFVFDMKADESDLNNVALIAKCTSNTDAILASAMISMMTRMADNPEPSMEEFVDVTKLNNFDGEAYDKAMLDWSVDLKQYVRNFAPFFVDMIDDCIRKAVDFSLTGPGIKKLRENMGLTQKAFAEKFHIKPGTLSHWEQGLRQPPDHVVYMLREIARLEQALQSAPISEQVRLRLVSDCLAQYGSDHGYVVEDNFPVCLNFEDKTYSCFSVEAAEKYGNRIVESFSEKQVPWGLYLDVVISGEV